MSDYLKQCLPVLVRKALTFPALTHTHTLKLRIGLLIIQLFASALSVWSVLGAMKTLRCAGTGLLYLISVCHKQLCYWCFLKLARRCWGQYVAVERFSTSRGEIFFSSSPIIKFVLKQGCLIIAAKGPEQHSPSLVTLSNRLDVTTTVCMSVAHWYTLSLPDSQEEENNSSINEDQRGWWFSNVQACSFDAREECEKSLGLDESLDAVRVAVKDLGPFDGILGFSQGAALVAMVCALQERKLEPVFNFRFAVLVAGFRSACTQHQHFYEDLQITLPSLHVFGQEDKVIPEPMSRDLLSMFPEANTLVHPGGHFIPAASAHRHIYQEFLQRFQ